MGRVVVLGSSNTDLSLSVARLPRAGETVLGEALSTDAGGKGANQAVAAKRAGASVTFLAAFGDDVLGNQARQTLATEGLDLVHCLAMPDASSGVALIMVDRGGRNLIGVGSGANGLWTKDHIDRLPDAVFDDSDVFVTQLEIPLDAALAGLARARRHGVVTVLNAAPANPALTLSSNGKELVDHLIVNESEAASLLGVGETTDFSASTLDRLGLARHWASQLASGVSCSAIITLGELGLVAAAGRKSWSKAPPTVVVVDTVGAGDAFVGAFACALSERRTLSEACDVALFASALSVTRRGAQASLPRRSEIDQALSVTGRPPNP